nr:MAG TPA: zona-pellucida-binding protein-like protein [Caudoviricetes sp.]
MGTTTLTTHGRRRKVEVLSPRCAGCCVVADYGEAHAGTAARRRRRRRDARNTATPARSVTCKPNAAARSSAVDSTGIKDAA